MTVGQICSIIFMTFNTCCCQCCPKDCVGLEYHSIEVVGQYELKLGPYMPTKVTDERNKVKKVLTDHEEAGVKSSNKQETASIPESSANLN